MTAKIAEALAAFQAEMPTVKKSQRAEVPTKSGGKYTYTYAGLADVMAAAMPLLTRHGLSFSTCPRLTDRGYELGGLLLHTSGEKLEGALPIAGNSPQEMGSSLTYMRRYLFGCMTGVVTDDDDDGNLAQRGGQRQQARKAAQPKPPAATAAAMTEDTRKAMFANFGERGITDKATQIHGITAVIGRQIESRSELTEAEALAVIQSLKERA